MLLLAVPKIYVSFFFHFSYDVLYVGLKASYQKHLKYKMRKKSDEDYEVRPEFFNTIDPQMQYLCT